MTTQNKLDIANGLIAIGQVIILGVAWLVGKWFLNRKNKKLGIEGAKIIRIKENELIKIEAVLEEKAKQERQAVLDAISELRLDVKVTNDRLDKEFGGNSGGAREAINSLGVEVKEIKIEQAKTNTHVAELYGRFQQSQVGATNG